MLFTTVVQRSIEAPSGNGLYIVSGSPFWFFFGEAKKNR